MKSNIWGVQHLLLLRIKNVKEISFPSLANDLEWYKKEKPCGMQHSHVVPNFKGIQLKKVIEMWDGMCGDQTEELRTPHVWKQADSSYGCTWWRQGFEEGLTVYNALSKGGGVNILLSKQKYRVMWNILSSGMRWTCIIKIMRTRKVILSYFS
jgi:hypothetical protein